MLRVSQSFYDRVNRGEQPQTYIIIQTALGSRVYGGTALSDIFVPIGSIADGSRMADGSVVAGAGDVVISKEARILDMGTGSRSLSAQNKELLSGFTSKRQGSASVKLNNADRELSRLIAKEPFINRPISFKLGFEDVATVNHITYFSGIIDRITIDLSSLALDVLEL